MKVQIIPARCVVGDCSTISTLNVTVFKVIIVSIPDCNCWHDAQEILFSFKVYTLYMKVNIMGWKFECRIRYTL